MPTYTDLPNSSSQTIILTNPTSDQQARIWSDTHTEWGHGLTQKAYVDREAYMLTIPLSRDGGVTHWALTEASADGTAKPLLSSCETLRKPALVRGKDGVVRDVWANGIASVYTHPNFRGKGYASKMISLLRGYMTNQQQSAGEPVFSVLFSDIGKTFYAKNGWIPRENIHAEFSVGSIVTDVGSGSIKLISIEDIPHLAELDEKLLREELSFPNPQDASKIRLALLPNANALLWGVYRDTINCNSLLGRKPTVHGAIYTPALSPSSRVWVIWTRNHYGGVENPEKNTLNFSRFVIEDKTISDDELAQAVKAILGAAATEAKDWNCGKIEMWNPVERVKKVLEQDKGLGATFVDRQNGNLASLNWFGEGSAEDVEWIANERFEWC